MQFAHELIVPEVGFPFKLFLFEGREGHYHREKHWHRSIEIFAVCDGELEFKIDEKTWHLTAGEFMIVNSNDVHEVDSPLPNETIVLQIPLKVFEKYYTGEQFIWFTHEPGRKDARFMELLEELYQTYCEKQCGYDMKMNSIFYHLLYLLVNAFVSVVTDTKDEIIIKAVNFAGDVDPVSITLDCQVQSDYTVTLLSGEKGDENSFEEPEKVKNITVNMHGASSEFVYDAPPYSVSVLRLKKCEAF